MQIVLKVCKYCGAQHCISHEKYNDRCEECGLRYNRFMASKNRSTTKDGTIEPTEGFRKVVLEYERLKADGFKVPRFFDKEWRI